VHQKTDAATTIRPAVPSRQPSAIRMELDQQRRFRMEQLQELTADAAEAIATADDPRLQVTRVLQLAARSALAEIEGALRRLEQGSYGTCERCTQPIPWERLEVLPMAGLCTPCQWTLESDQAAAERGRPGSRTRI
jgi:RNA polymerase-binding transcription factor DksA